MLLIAAQLRLPSRLVYDTLTRSSSVCRPHIKMLMQTCGDPSTLTQRCASPAQQHLTWISASMIGFFALPAAYWGPAWLPFLGGWDGPTISGLPLDGCCTELWEFCSCGGCVLVGGVRGMLCEPFCERLRSTTVFDSAGFEAAAIG